MGAGRRGRASPGRGGFTEPGRVSSGRSHPPSRELAAGAAEAQGGRCAALAPGRPRRGTAGRAAGPREDRTAAGGCGGGTKLPGLVAAGTEKAAGSLRLQTSFLQ